MLTVFVHCHWQTHHSLTTSSPRAPMFNKARQTISRVTYLSPNANCVSDVIFAVGKLPDAVVDSHTALPGGKVFLCHLYPAQRAHSKTLEDNIRQHQVTCGLGSIGIRLLGTTQWQGLGLLSALYLPLWTPNSVSKSSTAGRQNCNDL